MSGWGLRGSRSAGVAAVGAAAAFFLLNPAPVPAQMRALAPPQSTAPAPLAPGAGSPGATMIAPNPLAPAPLAQTEPFVAAGRVALAVAARYGRDAPLISGGLIWRVYAAKPDATGMFPLDRKSVV